MAEVFGIDFLTGAVFGILAFFTVYAYTVTFQAFKLPADGS